MQKPIIEIKKEIKEMKNQESSCLVVILAKKLCVARLNIYINKKVILQWMPIVLLKLNVGADEKKQNSG